MAEKLRFKRGDAFVMTMEEMPSGAAEIVINARGVTDTIVIPKAMRSTFADAFDLIAITLKLWAKPK